jgi:proteic killer suppression protein
VTVVCALDCNQIGDIRVKVRYADKKLAKLCTDELEMRKKRSDVADKLRRRIKAIETAERVGDLPTHDPLGRWHQLGADLDGLWAGELSRNHRLLIRPEGADEPWDAVTVTVTEIDDYH